MYTTMSMPCCGTCFGSVAIFYDVLEIDKNGHNSRNFESGKKISADLESSMFATFKDLQLIIVLSSNFAL